MSGWRTRPRIALSGKMGAGKSTTAALIAGLYRIPVLSFASGFKSLVESAGVTKEHDEELYRKLCQNIGGGLRAIDTDIWVKAFARRWLDETGGGACVVDDMRYPNEFDWLGKHEFYRVRLDVPEEVRATRRVLIAHESETALDGHAAEGRFDLHIRLDGTEPAEYVRDLVTTGYRRWLGMSS